MNNSPMQIVICGTDTDVGKTIVSTLLVQGLNAIYWKPIQTGVEENSDTKTVCNLLDLADDRWLPEIYKFQAPVSPHWAAEKENAKIDPDQLTLPSIKNSTMVIEMAGGVLVPLNRNWLQIDQLKRWQLPVIVVARSGLGTLNHSLLTLEALKNREIKTLGLILNGPHHSDNPRTLEEIGGYPILAELPFIENLNAKTLSKIWEVQNLQEKLKGLIECNFSKVTDSY